MFWLLVKVAGLIPPKSKKLLRLSPVKVISESTKSLATSLGVNVISTFSLSFSAIMFAVMDMVSEVVSTIGV